MCKRLSSPIPFVFSEQGLYKSLSKLIVVSFQERKNTYMKRKTLLVTAFFYSLLAVAASSADTTTTTTTTTNPDGTTTTTVEETTSTEEPETTPQATRNLVGPTGVTGTIRRSDRRQDRRAGDPRID